MSGGPDAKLTIRVTTTRGAVTYDYKAGGRYVSLLVGDVADRMVQQGLPPGTGSKAFWGAVLAAVSADIAAGHGGGT